MDIQTLTFVYNDQPNQGENVQWSKEWYRVKMSLAGSSQGDLIKIVGSPKVSTNWFELEKPRVNCYELSMIA